MYCVLGPVGTLTQDPLDPCACSITPFTAHVFTGSFTCSDKGSNSDIICYVDLACSSATPSLAFPGISWRKCDPYIDNIYSYTCISCPSGFYSETSSPQTCTPCPSSTYSATPGATSPSTCLPCPPTTPFSNAGSQTCHPPPETCLELTVSGCPHLAVKSALKGTYTLQTGPCGDLPRGVDDRPSYYNAVTENYVFYVDEKWKIGGVCGKQPILSYGSVSAATAECWESASGESEQRTKSSKTRPLLPPSSSPPPSLPPLVGPRLPLLQPRLNLDVRGERFHPRLDGH